MIAAQVALVVPSFDTNTSLICLPFLVPALIIIINYISDNDKIRVTKSQCQDYRLNFENGQHESKNYLKTEDHKSKRKKIHS